MRFVAVLSSQRQVNAEFSYLMEEIFNHPNAIRACCTDPNMMEKITAMDANLEVIQKSLDQYLETKRYLLLLLLLVVMMVIWRRR